MMTTITVKRNGETETKRVQSFALKNMIAAFRSAGYEVIEDTPAVAEMSPSAAVQTGRVGKGREVHEIVEGHSKCGASYRRNSLGSIARQVVVTGEKVTCSACR